MVEFLEGSVEAFQAFCKQAQGGQHPDDTIVKIEGVVCKLGTSYSIMQYTSENAKIGIKFTVEGWADNQYPADNTKVILTASLVRSPFFFQTLSVKPEDITIL